MGKEFKFEPEDFGKLTVKVHSMDLDFDVFDDHTIVDSVLCVTVLEPITELRLNAKNLEIKEVSCQEDTVTHEYLKDDSILVVKFSKEIMAETKLNIVTKTICRPTNNILEGMYFDETPQGCPCTQITQCQQWGFQRIVPCIDDMTAKCVYRTKITADSRYTNMITNGDVVADREGVGEGREKIVYHNTTTPMATYLFFLGVGTYATFTKEFKYPDGSSFDLELLVPPDSDPTVANQALQVLHDAIMWVHLFTGAKKYENEGEAWSVMEACKQGKHGTPEVMEMIKGREWGYKYTGEVYREIGMQNSDFGGMENVGNTTITTNRIMPFPEMTDPAWEYMIRVKVHEYYHNLNGSEVTGWSPFEIWLNEAVTVHIEREYHAFLFGEDYHRLSVVLTLMSPHGGTFNEDLSAASMPIEPDGFNDPNELITGMTYVKAPEFVRMIQLVMGKEKFVEGLALYHKKYKHSNATRAQWIEAMEEVSGKDFKRMAQMWLKQTGFPEVSITKEYDGTNFKIHIKQHFDSEHWEFPIVIGLVDPHGQDIAEKTVWMQDPEMDVVFENVKEPEFVSFNRGYSFYGKVRPFETRGELLTQAQVDHDKVNRHLAFARLMNEEMEKLVKDPSAKVDQSVMTLFVELISQEYLIDDVGSGFLIIREHTEDPNLAHKYQLLYDAKKKILKSIAMGHHEWISKTYQQYYDKVWDGDYVEANVQNIKFRQIKNLLLTLMSTYDNDDAHAMIKKQFTEAANITDKLVAFSLYINSSASDKMDLINSFEVECKKSLVLWEAFLGCIARNDSDDYLEIIKKIESSPDFRIEQANDQRALYAVFASNKKKSLLTPEGRSFLLQSIKKLAPVNEYTTLYLLKVFGQLDKMDAEHYVSLVTILVEVLDSVDSKKLPSVYNTTIRILKGSPKAVSAYEAEKGKIALLEE